MWKADRLLSNGWIQVQFTMSSTGLAWFALSRFLFLNFANLSLAVRKKTSVTHQSTANTTAIRSLAFYPLPTRQIDHCTDIDPSFLQKRETNTLTGLAQSELTDVLPVNKLCLQE